MVYTLRFMIMCSSTPLRVGHAVARWPSVGRTLLRIVRYSVANRAPDPLYGYCVHYIM